MKKRERIEMISTLGGGNRSSWYKRTQCNNSSSINVEYTQLWPVWPEKIAKNDFTIKIKDIDTFTKLPKNVGNLGKLIVAKGFKSLPKVQ